MLSGQGCPWGMVNDEGEIDLGIIWSSINLDLRHVIFD